MSLNEEFRQRAEWQIRLIRAVAFREHGTETLIAMIMAGLNQAHAEGLDDAAFVCDAVAANGDKVAALLARNLRRLKELNGRNSSPSGEGAPCHADVLLEIANQS